MVTGSTPMTSGNLQICNVMGPNRFLQGYNTEEITYNQLSWRIWYGDLPTDNMGYTVWKIRMMYTLRQSNVAVDSIYRLFSHQNHNIVWWFFLAESSHVWLPESTFFEKPGFVAGLPWCFVAEIAGWTAVARHPRKLFVYHEQSLGPETFGWEE